MASNKKPTIPSKMASNLPKKPVSFTPTNQKPFDVFALIDTPQFDAFKRFNAPHGTTTVKSASSKTSSTSKSSGNISSSKSLNATKASPGKPSNVSKVSAASKRPASTASLNKVFKKVRNTSEISPLPRVMSNFSTGKRVGTDSKINVYGGKKFFTKPSEELLNALASKEKTNSGTSSSSTTVKPCDSNVKTPSDNKRTKRVYSPSAEYLPLDYSVFQDKQFNRKAIFQDFVNSLSDLPNMEKLEFLDVAEKQEKAIFDVVHSAKAYRSKMTNLLLSIRKSRSLSQFLEMIIPKTPKAKFFEISKNLQICCLKQLLPDEEALRNNGYWYREETQQIPVSNRNEKTQTIDLKTLDDNTTLRCTRCGLEFLYKNIRSQECRYHEGKRLFDRALNGKTFTCCNKPSTEPGCSYAATHTFDGSDLKIVRDDFVDTEDRPFTDDDKLSVYTLDCEMIFTTRGHELARLTLISIEGHTIIDTYVEPKGDILDYVTKFSGIREEEFALQKKISFEAVRKQVLNLIAAKTFLIGHGLDNDLKSLKIIHKRILDSAILFPHRLGPPMKLRLKNLANEYLFRNIQNEDETGHDSLEDCLAAQDLILFKVNDYVRKIRPENL